MAFVYFAAGTVLSPVVGLSFSLLMMTKDNCLAVVDYVPCLPLNVLCSVLAAQVLPVENSRPAYEAGLLQGAEADQEEPF